MRTLILYLSIIVLFFFGCKKYPEDDTLIHFRKAPKRMEYFGPWYIKEYKVNDADSIPFVNTKYYWLNPITEVPHYYKRGNIQFYDKYSKVNIGTDFIGHTRSIAWTILKLDRKDFKVIKEYNSKKYFIWFQNRK